MQTINPAQSHDGYVILLSVLFISAISLSVGIFVVQSSLLNSQNSFMLTQSYQAQSLAEGCAEEALQAIRDDVNYTGMDTISFMPGECTYEVINQGAQAREIRTQGSMGQAIHRLQITLDSINPQIQITSWQTVVDF